MSFVSCLLSSSLLNLQSGRWEVDSGGGESEGGIPIDHLRRPLHAGDFKESDLPLYSGHHAEQSKLVPELQDAPRGLHQGCGPERRRRRPAQLQDPDGPGQRERGLGDSTWPGESVTSAGPSSASISSSSRMRLEFPTAQPGSTSPTGHRPRGHTISVSAPSSRRERRMDRDSYHNRGGPSNAEKSSGLSPR